MTRHPDRAVLGELKQHSRIACLLSLYWTHCSSSHHVDRLDCMSCRWIGSHSRPVVCRVSKYLSTLGVGSRLALPALCCHVSSSVAAAPGSISFVGQFSPDTSYS